MAKFPFFFQSDSMACGATCLKMIAKFYGNDIDLVKLIDLAGTTRNGVNFLGLATAAGAVGFRTLGVKMSLERLLSTAPLPAIAHWDQNHFVVIYKISKNKIFVADPGIGLVKYTMEDFTKHWSNSSEQEGALLLLLTTEDFFLNNNAQEKRESILFFYKYFSEHRRSFLQLALGLILGLLFQLIFPFLSQALVDVGIKGKDVNFVSLVLLAQLVLFLGRVSIEIIRSFLLIHISSRINISLISDFFKKLTRLPISYFEVKLTGDILQRINDNRRIEQFLTSSTLNTIFSIFSLIVLTTVLLFYNSLIFSVFAIGSILYFAWIAIFTKKRSIIDNERFKQSAENQSQIIEFINGMQEIKLHNAEEVKLKEWGDSQIKTFNISLKSLSLSTTQNTGSLLINELKNIVTTFLAVKLVMDETITLGMMFSISYIIGQLNSPVTEMVNFFQRLQDAKLSLRRLNEIHNKDEEKPIVPSEKRKLIWNSSIEIVGVDFSYPGMGSQLILNNLSVTIARNKITAVVGSSGSGKTTFMKLLLKYYLPSKGVIKVGEYPLEVIDADEWRENVGVVLQEGYIFNASIANNISLGQEIDFDRLRYAAEIANINKFIDDLPNKFDTKIGMEGVGLSTGQKQRILIARAVYKNPKYLFFDEATSALDANNEKIIMQNLARFFEERTVFIIAHRLSTVMSADQIIVLENGTIIERGTHQELTKLKGSYFNLVKNQLELGS